MFVEMHLQIGEIDDHFPSVLDVDAIHPKISAVVVVQQVRPYRSLMVGMIPRPLVPLIAGLEIWIIGIQGPQSKWG